MTIQPPSNRPREISVTEPVELAYERVKQILFRPFDLTKWIVIGFCAWLAGLGEAGGGGGGFNGGKYNFGGNRHDVSEEFRHVYQQVHDYVLANLAWLLPLAIFLTVVGLVLWVVVKWVSSRGKFMFLHCVALNRAEVEAPWAKYAAVANSLFWFRLVVSLATLIFILPVVAVLLLDILRMLLRGTADVPGVMMAVGLGLLCFLLSLVFALVRKFLADFVVPIMFLRGGNCLTAWRELGGLLSAHPGKFALYILFQIVLSMAIGVIVLLAVVATCCVAGCLMALPFIGTVVLLPVLVFKRAYPLYYMAQYGPRYDVFPKSAMPPPAPEPPSNAPLAPLGGV